MYIKIVIACICFYNFVGSTLLRCAESSDRRNEVLTDPSITWGSPTNSIVAGLCVVYNNDGESVEILLMSLETNANFYSYIGPPSRQLSHLELTKPDGVKVSLQRKGMAVQADLPKSIKAGDIPHTRDGLFIGHGSISNYQCSTLGLVAPCRY